MTNDAKKINREITKLKMICEGAKLAWVTQNHNGGDWGVVCDEIVRLRQQCDLLLSLEYLGTDPPPLTTKDISEFARDFDTVLTNIISDLAQDKPEWAIKRMCDLRDALNQANLPKASEKWTM